MTKLFGTDGIRGEAGKFPLDSATVEIVGASLASHLGRKVGRSPRILIGRDTRESGEWIEEALIDGITKAGADAQSAGVITTPGVAFLARTLPADAGVVISASHNVYSDNGLKVFAPSGRKLDEETERLIERDVVSGLIAIEPFASTPSGKVITGFANQVDLKARYVNFLVNEIGRNLSLDGMKVLLDCANGASSDLAPYVFSQLGANVIAINNTPDGRNINLNSGSLHTEFLQREVVRQKADLGIAFDGDADRSLFVESGGRLINGDTTLWVLANYLKTRGKLKDNVVVATVMSNIGLEIALQSKQIRLVRTDVGDKYVLDELLKSGASLGGEQSGHIILPELSLAGDGLITSLCLLRAITEENKRLSELAQGLETLPQILVNVTVKEKRPFNEVDAIQAAAAELQNELGSRGRLLLRYSGTEPLARVMIEGDSQSKIEQQAKELARVIQSSIGA